MAADEAGRKRHAEGRQAFSRLIRQLLFRNHFSHQNLRDLSEWANPDGPNWLSTSQISYIRTGRLQAIGPRTIDALAQANLALARLSGDDSREAMTTAHLPGPPRKLRPLLEAPWFLRHPETQMPMDAGDLYRVWLGRLDPAKAASYEFSDDEAAQVSQSIRDAVQQWAQGQGLTLAAAKGRILAAFPSDEPARLERLMWVLSGFEVYSGEQLHDELQALAIMVATLRGIEPERSESDLLDALYAGRSGDGSSADALPPDVLRNAAARS